TFRPDKNLEKKTKELLEGNDKNSEEDTKKYFVIYENLTPLDFILCKYQEDSIEEAKINFKTKEDHNVIIRYFSYHYQVDDHNIEKRPSYNVRLFYRQKSHFFTKLVGKRRFKDIINNLASYTNSTSPKILDFKADFNGCEIDLVEDWKNLSVKDFTNMIHFLEFDHGEISLEYIRFVNLELDDIRKCKMPKPKSIDVWGPEFII
ncbi:MAG: hypothetical protein L6408_02390, partial [Nanoarchaeota archaeon]|nr:hypothetical protein [Nanoarchaeota archaeon]